MTLTDGAARNPFSLDGRRALVTGANTGIGQAIALGLAQAGAEVICAGRRDCDETVAAIRAAGGAAEGLRVDFADPMAGQGLFGGAPIDILVNNAGAIRRADAADFTEADWDAVMDVNLKALFFTTQAFAKAVFARGGAGAVYQGQMVQAGWLASAPLLHGPPPQLARLALAS